MKYGRGAAESPGETMCHMHICSSSSVSVLKIIIIAPTIFLSKNVAAADHRSNAIVAVGHVAAPAHVAPVAVVEAIPF